MHLVCFSFSLFPSSFLSVSLYSSVWTIVFVPRRLFDLFTACMRRIKPHTKKWNYETKSKQLENTSVLNFSRTLLQTLSWLSYWTMCFTSNFEAQNTHSVEILLSPHWKDPTFLFIYVFVSSRFISEKLNVFPFRNVHFNYRFWIFEWYFDTSKVCVTKTLSKCALEVFKSQPHQQFKIDCGITSNAYTKPPI